MNVKIDLRLTNAEKAALDIYAASLQMNLNQVSLWLFNEALTQKLAEKGGSNGN